MINDNYARWQDMDNPVWPLPQLLVFLYMCYMKIVSVLCIKQLILLQRSNFKHPRSPKHWKECCNSCSDLYSMKQTRIENTPFLLYRIACKTLFFPFLMAYLTQCLFLKFLTHFFFITLFKDINSELQSKFLTSIKYLFDCSSPLKI